MKVYASLLIAAALCCAQKPEAVVDPVRYGVKDLIHLSAKRGFTSLILFPAGEEIAEVSCGDSAFWVIDGKDNVLHVKPAKAGTTTNINVVLRSKAVFSFYVEEVGEKGAPDLKLVIGPTDAQRLRERNADLEKQSAQREDAHRMEIAGLKQDRERSAVIAKKQIDDASKITSEKLAEFLANQKFNYFCYSKPSVCLALVLATDSKTLVVGRLGDNPGFSGKDEKGEWHSAIKFRRINSVVYELEYRVTSGTITFNGRNVGFYAN